jgi:hypothetical protein
MFKLFLDDERFPPAPTEEWVVKRTVPSAVRFMISNGCPSFISFDNDLGGVLEGRHLATWMVRHDLDSGATFIPRILTSLSTRRTA